MYKKILCLPARYVHSTYILGTISYPKNTYLPHFLFESTYLRKYMCRKYHFVDAFWCFVCAMKNEPKKDTYVTMNGRPNEWDGLRRLIITHTNFSREELLTCQDAVVVREKKVS